MVSGPQQAGAAAVSLSSVSERGGFSRQQNQNLTAARAFEAHARTVVQSLTGHFAWKTVLWFAGVIAGLSSVSALTLTGYLSYWAAIPINAVLIYFIFTPLHEAVHDNIVGPYKGLRWLEVLIGQISGFILLAPYPGFRQLHLHHHQHTNDPQEDPDYWARGDNFFYVVLRCLVIQPVYIAHLYKIANDPVTMRAFIEEIIFFGVYIVIIAAAYALGFGPELMLLWILPGYFGVVLCPLFFDWPVHHPHSERGRYTDSAILLFPKPVRAIVDFFFCGHAYHLMHHLYPRIPFYHYGTAYYALASELAGVGAKIRDLRQRGALEPAE